MYSAEEKRTSEGNGEYRRVSEREGLAAALENAHEDNAHLESSGVRKNSTVEMRLPARRSCGILCAAFCRPLGGQRQGRRFEKNFHVGNPGANGVRYGTRAGRLQDDLLQAEAAQSVAEAKVGQLRLELADLPPTRIVDQTAGLGNDGTDRMREQLYVLQLKREDARSRYTDDHPKMRQIEDQVHEAQQTVDRQPATRTQVTTGASRFYDDVRTGLLEEEPSLASLGAKTGVLRQQLAQVNGQLKTFNRDQLRIAVLARDVELCQADYRKYAVSVEQSRIDQALATERMSNLSVVQPASYEVRPVRPQKALNLALGLLLGAVGGVAAAVIADGRDRRLRAPQDVESKLGLAALGALPQLRARELALHTSKRR